MLLGIVQKKLGFRATFFENDVQLNCRTRMQPDNVTDVHCGSNRFLTACVAPDRISSRTLSHEKDLKEQPECLGEMGHSGRGELGNTLGRGR